jgi:ornithine cyclodeaminase
MKERNETEFPAEEFCDIAAGKKPGRTSPDQITIFKSNGLAIQDVAVAGYLYETLIPAPAPAAQHPATR